MKARVIFVVVLATILALFSVGAGAQDVAREDIVIFDIDGASVPSPFNFNWFVPGTARNQGMHQAVWEPLFILNYENGEIQPWLGESFVANDALDVWTLTLNEGITWQDGEAMNADDVVWTISMLTDPDNIGLNEAANMQQWIESVEKVDDLTVNFNLKAPNPRFQLDFFSVRIWGSILIMPEHIFSDVEDIATFTFYDPEQGWPFGTGPYSLVSSSETEFIYDRHDEWWGVGTIADALPEPLRLEFIVTGPEQNKSLLMADAQLDSAMDITLGAYEAIVAQNPNVIAWYEGMPFAWPDPCARQLSLNFEVEPWDNVDMRKAVSMLIDRNQVIEIAYEGTSIPSRTAYVDYGGLASVFDLVEDIHIDPAADVAAAQALIEANGYEMNSDGFYEMDGEVLSLPIQVSESFIEKRRIANVVVEQLRAGGIDATANVIAGGTWQDNKDFGNYEGTLDWDFCGSINEPWASLNRMTSTFYRPIGERAPSGNNHLRWSGEANEEYTALVDELGSLPLGAPETWELAAEAYRILDANQVVVPISQAKKLIPFDTTYWTGWPTATNNYNHPATWWNSTHQIIHNLEKAN